MIFVMALKGVAIFLPIFEKGYKWEQLFCNFFNIDPYFMTYPWKDLLTRNNMRLRKCFYDIPDQNGSLSKLTSRLPLTGYHTGQSWHAKLYIAPLFLLYLPIYNEASLKKVLQLKICLPHILEAAQIFYLKAFFGGTPCFKQQDKRKVMMQFTTENTNLIRNGRLLRLEKW